MFSFGTPSLWARGPDDTYTGDGTNTIETGEIFPPGVREIIVLFHGIRTVSSLGPFVLQLGHAGGFEASGYTNSSTRIENGVLPAVTVNLTGFLLGQIFSGGIPIANAPLNGRVVITKLAATPELPNIPNYCASGVIGTSAADCINIFGGSKGLSADVTQLRVVDQSGAGVSFTNVGQMNVMWRMW